MLLALNVVGGFMVTTMPDVMALLSSRGSISYEVAKELARILKPLVGSSPHHSKNTGDFIQQIKEVKLQADEIITSYDVSALFTSVPVEDATKIIQRKLELDQQLHLRTKMKVEHITSLLEFGHRTIYFQFQGNFYEQINGAAMGSPISPIVANLFMEEFEVRAIQTGKKPSKDVEKVCGWHLCHFEVCKEGRVFSHHINNIDPKFQLTSEESKTDGSIPFLDCLVTPQADGSILTAVYRKPTHSDMYLHWESYHHLAAKYSVINTLRHRAKTVCTSKQSLEKEEDHLFHSPQKDANILYGPGTEQTSRRNRRRPIKGPVTTTSHLLWYPTWKDWQNHARTSGRRYGVEVYFKGGRTIKDILVHPKDKDTILKKSGVIYKYSCGRVDCGEEYIGESGRTFGERYREHMRSPSPIMDHHNTTGHEVSLDNFTIVGREDNNIARNIREAIFIRVNDPSLNRNIGRFQLPHIWDEVLARSPELHLK